MRCPKCKKDDVETMKDASYILVAGKLKKLPGFYCPWCCISWTVPKDSK